MARTFIAVTQEEIDIRVADSLRSREFELASYDFERETHEAALMALGEIEWDETNVEFKNLSRDATVARATEKGMTSEQIQHIANLQARDKHKLGLESVKIETTISERHYAKTLTALPEGTRRTTAINAVKTREDLTRTR